MNRHRAVVGVVRSLRLERPINAVFGSVIGAETNRPVFHLTYDDGPHPVVTPQVIEALDEFDSRATFFLLAERAARHPELVAELVRKGHEIALHTRTHPRLTETPWNKMVDEIRRARHDLEDLAQREVRWFRPPYGAQNFRSLALTRTSRMQTLLWSVDSRDWKGLSPNSPLEASIDGLVPGGILLLHDTPVEEEMGSDLERGYVEKGQLTRLYLEELADRGLTPVSLDELLASGPPRRKAKFG